MSGPASQAPPAVSVIIPALDEEETIAAVLDRVLALPVAKEIVVVNDGSRDRTGEILAGYADRVTILTNPERTGKGSAIRQALQVAAGEVVVIQDADLEYLPEELPLVVEPILAGRANVVLGTRFSKGLPKGMALPNKIVNVLLAWSVRLLFFRRITDEATCYKAVRRSVLLRMNLTCHRFEFCPEVVAKAIRLGETIVEVPISYTPRTKTAGKKIRWTDAPEAFWTLLRHRFWRC
ncbi:MAG TPA: glycosyltransferase family 2 protein [Fimbriimonadaceae bacterium]|nr:glycosyltransferase family 2 protein [Fimbriimonadaceae bacterium]